jgi:glycosyltransferase involved in cell wall biosynthesis
MSEGLHQTVGIPFAQIQGVNISLPKVDVIIGNYKQGRFVRDAILSVSQQSFSSFECVIVDDASQDGSADVIRRVLRELDDKRFSFIERQENGGQMAAMLTGLEQGNSPFVAFLDADDVWLPSYLETHISCHLNSHLNAAMSSVNLAVINAEGVLIAGTEPGYSGSRPTRSRDQITQIPSIRSLRKHISDKETEGREVTFVKKDHMGWFWSPTSGLMFKRPILEIIRPENVRDFRSCADVYWAKFSHLIGGSIVLHGVHGYYRLHGSNMYSYPTVFGDGYLNGGGHDAVKETTRRTIIEKLLSDKAFIAILPISYIAKSIIRLTKSPLEYLAMITHRTPYDINHRLQKRLRRRAFSSTLKKVFLSNVK